MRVLICSIALLALIEAVAAPEGDRWRGAGLPWGSEMPGLEDARALGMNVVRVWLPYYWNRYKSADRCKEHLETVDRRLEELDGILSRAERLGLKVVIAAAPIGGNTEGHEFADMKLFYDTGLQNCFEEMWRRTARRFRGRRVVCGYDLINEPLDRGYDGRVASVRDFMIRLTKAIRAEDPAATVIVEPNANGAPSGFEVKSRWGLPAFEALPFDNIVYSVHVYQPMGFTHQGIGKKADEYPHRTYPGEGENERWDKDFVRRELAAVRDFQLRTGARIWVGEFSSAAWTTGGARYLADLIDIFEEYGWDWSYHAFRENPIWSLEHAGADNLTLKKSDVETDRMAVLKSGWAKNAPRVPVVSTGKFARSVSAGRE